MTWLSALMPFVAASSLILAPGLVALAPLRMGLTARVALSGVVGVAALGVAEMVFGFLAIQWAPWQPFAPAVLLAIMALVVRRRWPSLALPPDRARPVWLILGWIAAALVIGIVAFVLVPSPDRISQTYDNVFHLSAVARILDFGDASSLTLRTMIETNRAWSFYPAGWHGLVASVVQLTGTSVAIAANATWLAVCAAIWIPGAGWLAQVLVRPSHSGVAVLVATPLAAAFGSMPYALLTWGTLYPTFLAMAILPASVALPVLIRRVRGTVRHPDRTGFWITVSAGLVLVAVAIGVAQPRALPTWALLLAPFIVGMLGAIARSAIRAGGRQRHRAIVTLSSGSVVLVLAVLGALALATGPLGLFDRPLDDRLNGPQARADQSPGAGLLQVLGQAWPTGVTGTVTGMSPLLAAAVVIGLVVAARTPRLRWLVISYALMAGLYVAAAGSDGALVKLVTALWYKDRYRLASAIPVLGVALATIGILALSAVLARRPAVRRAVAIGSAWVVGLTSAAILAVTGTSESAAVVFRLTARHDQTAIASGDQMQFLRTLSVHIPEDQRIANDPWDGSTLALVLGHREPVFPHVNGQWDPDRQMLAFHLDQVGTDPAVCAALDRLRVRFVLYNDHEFAGGDPAGNLFPAVHRAVEAGMFPLVATDGRTSLYRIEQCGPLLAGEER